MAEVAGGQHISCGSDQYQNSSPESHPRTVMESDELGVS